MFKPAHKSRLTLKLISLSLSGPNHIAIAGNPLSIMINIGFARPPGVILKHAALITIINGSPDLSVGNLTRFRFCIYDGVLATSRCLSSFPSVLPRDATPELFP